MSTNAWRPVACWAATTRRRLALACGRRHTVGDAEVYSLPPSALAAASPQTLRELQFTWRKSEYLIEAARAVTDGRLDLDALRQAPNAPGSISR